MKSHILKLWLFSLVLTLVVSDADAQRRGRRRGATETTTGNTNTQQTTEQTNNTRTNTGYDPYGGIPIEVDTTSGAEKVKPSLRNDNAFEKGFINDRTPLPYEHLRWDDALFVEKVWRELDLREKMNQTFRYKGQESTGSQLFFDILMQAIEKDSVVAFTDDRFTTPLDSQQVTSITAGGAPDTTAQTDINDPSKVVKYVVTRSAFDPTSIMKLRIKEEWVFDREASRMFVRILGIAPVKETVRVKGQAPAQEVLFWVYYPDLRKTLARYEVYNPKNMGYGRMTWEELFESRMFSSYITKSTLDNPGNRTLKQMYGKEQILALLEGDNIKERIFNYEQDLWQY